MSSQTSSVEHALELRESVEDCSLHRRRRNRTVFSREAISAMEEQFGRNRYPDIHRRETLAESIGIPEARVQVWFQNRRARRNKRMSDSQRKWKDADSDDDGGRAPASKKMRLSSGDVWTTAWEKEAPLSRPPSPLYDHHQQLQLQYDRLFAYFNTPYTAFTPPPQTSPPHPFSRQISSPPWIPNLHAHPGNDVNITRETDDNFVDRMFRFSAPAYQKIAAREVDPDPEKVAYQYQMTFPSMNSTMYSMTSLPVTRGFNVDTLLMRAPRMSDARDALETDNDDSS